MFKLFIIFIIILIILFPIKIKLTIFFNGKTLQVKIFKFNILNININDSLKNIFNKINTDKNSNKDVMSNKKKKSKLLGRININKTNLFANLISNKYKPVIIFYNSFSYSTEDAAFTAVLYGVFNTLIYSLFSFLNLLLNIEIKENTIQPIFEDKTSVNFNNKSIIKVNLVQIIIMLVIILKNIKFKGGTQKGNTYGK